MGKKKKILEIHEKETAKGRKISAEEIARIVGVSGSYARQIIRSEKIGVVSRDTCEPKSSVRTVKLGSLIDQERLDTKKIIREGLKTIPVGHLAYDENFRRDLQIARDRWQEYSREEEFDPYRATLPTRKIVWGKEATINELKRQDGVT